MNNKCSLNTIDGDKNMATARYLVMLVLLLFVVGLNAQHPYGVGDNIQVPYVPPGTLTMDGFANETAWDNAVEVDIMAYWEGDWSGHPDPDVDATLKLLWTDDTLFAYFKVEDYQLYFPEDNNGWRGEHFMIGVDRTMKGDRQEDGGWGGWTWNAPDLGPTVYKVYDKGITSNWGFDGIEPVDSGWVGGTVVVDEDNFEWSVEMWIWLPNIKTNSMIGFNAGGAAATPDPEFIGNIGQGSYAWYCWHPRPWDVEETGYPSDFLAGDIQRRARSFGTITFVGGPTPYGVDDNINVPYVAPGTITTDGMADEAAWENAAEVDIMAYWEGDWSGHPDPDVDAMAKVLWTNDTLFVFFRVEDYQLYFDDTGNPWRGEHFMVAVDGPMRGTDDPDGWTYDHNWGGAPWNMPDLGPTTYKVFDGGITANWGYDGVFPADSGWTGGTVLVDEDNFTWQVEMWIYLPQVKLESRVGFNVGGAAATPDPEFIGNIGQGSYAWYAWHPVPEDVDNVGYPSDYLAGDIQRRVAFGTLTFVTDAVSVDDTSPVRGIPTDITLYQNYPNPFNPETRIMYTLPNTAQVNLSVYNMLGQRVAVLVNNTQVAGRYEVVWNANAASSGLYFYQLQVDNKLIETKRMILLK
jgi:hypothetical protein